jgi:hypothetical protein
MRKKLRRQGYDWEEIEQMGYGKRQRKKRKRDKESPKRKYRPHLWKF